MNRMIFYPLMLGLLVLVYIGPGSCMRGDKDAVKSAEAEAKAAEEAAMIPPELSREEAQASIDKLELALTRWENTPTFWDDFFLAYPDGLTLTELTRSEPESLEGGTHTRILAVSLSLSVLKEDESGVVTGVPAPGGLQASVDWIMDMRDRPDIKLQSLEIVDSGPLKATFKVYFLDEIEENIEESEEVEPAG